MRFTKRKYLDRPPRVGDRIVIVNGIKYLGPFNGDEMIVTDIDTYTGDCVFAFNPRQGREICVGDYMYRIYKDVTYEHLGYNTEVKRFLGIPIYKKTTEIIREV